MKTKIKYIVFILFIIVFASCKKPNHYVRVTSDFIDTLTSFTVGPDNYGTITAGVTTGFQHMPEGTWNVYGYDKSSKTTGSGTVSVYGHGTHYWTVKIDDQGNISILPD